MQPYMKNVSVEYAEKAAPGGEIDTKIKALEEKPSGTKLYDHELKGFTIYQGCTLHIISTSNTPVIDPSSLNHLVKVAYYITGGGVGSAKDSFGIINVYGSFSPDTLKILYDNNAYSGATSPSIVYDQRSFPTITDTVTPL